MTAFVPVGSTEHRRRTRAASRRSGRRSGSTRLCAALGPDLHGRGSIARGADPPELRRARRQGAAFCGRWPKDLSGSTTREGIENGNTGIRLRLSAEHRGANRRSHRSRASASRGSHRRRQALERNHEIAPRTGSRDDATTTRRTRRPSARSAGEGPDERSIRNAGPPQANGRRGAHAPYPCRCRASRCKPSARHPSSPADPGRGGRPAHEQGACQGADGGRNGGRRGLCRGLDPECHRHRIGRQSRSLLESLDRLAGVCDPDTKVVVIGHVNDVLLYRELMRRGVSEYLIAPVEHLAFIQSISELFHGEKPSRSGRVHRGLWRQGRLRRVDGRPQPRLDHLAPPRARDRDRRSRLPSEPRGSTSTRIRRRASSKRFDARPPRRDLDGAAPVDARGQSESARRTRHPRSPFRVRRKGLRSVDRHSAASVPCIILDLPHHWNAPVKRLLLGADQILLVAEPDLANLRNAKSVHELLKAARPNDAPPPPRPQQDGRAQASRDRGGRFRQGGRHGSDRSSPMTRNFSDRPRITVR